MEYSEAKNETTKKKTQMPTRRVVKNHDRFFFSLSKSDDENNNNNSKNPWVISIEAIPVCLKYKLCTAQCMCGGGAMSIGRLYVSLECVCDDFKFDFYCFCFSWIRFECTRISVVEYCRLRVTRIIICRCKWETAPEKNALIEFYIRQIEYGRRSVRISIKTWWSIRFFFQFRPLFLCGQHEKVISIASGRIILGDSLDSPKHCGGESHSHWFYSAFAMQNKGILANMEFWLWLGFSEFQINFPSKLDRDSLRKRVNRIKAKQKKSVAHKSTVNKGETVRKKK